MLFDDRCECECHEEGRNIRHFAPCCYRCGICHSRIDAMSYQRHTKKCQEEHQAMLKRFAEQASGKCEHNWVLDGHNAGEGICSKCLARE